MDYAGICCDWMSGRHEYPYEVEAMPSGRILRLDRDGVIEWETMQWEQIRCPSSDTSIRVRCDGRILKFSGNIGRFQESDNREGLTVVQCVEKFTEVLGKLGFDMRGFGSRLVRKVEGDTALDGDAAILQCGTYLTRIDLAGNFQVSDYSALCSSMLIRRIGQKLPMAGKYGPVWGYDAKRSNWWKAKFYDKQAELDGKRRPNSGATLARFEVQLGSEWLKREGLDRVYKWRGDEMGKVIYGQFADQVFRESLSVMDWAEIPSRLRAYAVLWRDGVDIRTVLGQSQYYATRAKLMQYGIDIGTSCNVTALTRNCRIVEVAPVSALRRAA